MIKKNSNVELPLILTEIPFKDVPTEDEHLPYTTNQFKDKFNDEKFILSEIDIKKLIKTMEKGHESEFRICVYLDYLLSSMNPDFSNDADKDVRDNDNNRPDIHPCYQCHTDADNNNVLGGQNIDETYCDMLKYCQRHRHTQNYCINSFQKCRFHFSRPHKNLKRLLIKQETKC
jgi:hypothetical protein